MPAFEVDLLWLGWEYDPPSHDKIWGYLTTGGQCFTFWGKRGAKPTFKRLSRMEAIEVRDKKRHRYVEYTHRPDAVHPDMIEFLTTHVTAAVLLDRLKKPER